MVVNHKVYLYKPDGTTFLGELIVDNLRADIKLQDLSVVTFRIPEVVNGQVNPRIDEVLDSYIIELWYGKVDGVYANGDFEKIRFRIYSTPLDFADYKYLHSYSGYSIQSDLEFKQIISWPGVQVKDFFRTITYNNNASTPKFLETGFEYTISTSTNTSATKYITVGTTDEPTDLDIFIYEKRVNNTTGTESETALIELTSGGVNSNNFKPGYYVLNKTGDIVDSVSIALPYSDEDPPVGGYTVFDGEDTTGNDAKIFSYKFYDNPTARIISVGINTNTEQPLNNMYITLAQDAAEGDDTPEYGGYTFTSQSIYTKNGLKLNDILTGGDVAADGILYNTGFTVGTISETIAAKYRSNIDFNNITVHQAVKEIAESFDAIPVFDTINRTVSFYAENEYGSNNGLVLKYATYLKSINKEIDASKIITSARALGKDNITISLINPTGSDKWEDYTYFLDDYHIPYTDGEESNSKVNIAVNGSNSHILDLTYQDTTGYQSRWMEASEAAKIAKWQYNRDYWHYVLSNHNATTLDSSHNNHKGLYLQRDEKIKLYVKREREYEEFKAVQYKNYYLLEHYKDLYENKGTNKEQYDYYLLEYNNAVAAADNFKTTDLDPLYDDLYDTETSGTVAYKFAEVQAALDKSQSPYSVDMTKIRTFVRETSHNDSKIDNEKDLVAATKTFIDENKEPRVTFNIGIIDVLEAQEAYEDWDKFAIGDKIYIYFPEFNIDLEAQIREISIDFQQKTLSLVISTVRNYNRSFGSYLTKNIRRFHNASMNTVMYYKDGSQAAIENSEDARDTFDSGISTVNTSVSTGATDASTGDSSTTLSGEGQQSRVVTGVDLYTEALTLGVFTKGIKVTDGRLLAFKPVTVGEGNYDSWVQEVEVSAENGFVIRRVYPYDDSVTKLAYIDADDGSAYFAGWELEPGQLSSGTGSTFVGISSDSSNSYAFWAGDETAANAPFSVTKDGDITATSGTISGLDIGVGYISTSDKAGQTNPKNAIFKRALGGAGVWGENETAFYLDEDGRFSLSNELTWNPSTNTFFVNGTIEATIGIIGGWTVNEDSLSKSFDAGLTNDVNIYAGTLPAAISTPGAGEFGFAVENTNPDTDYPFLVAMTNKGFYVFTDTDAANSYANPVSAMEITYDENYIWAKGLLISDDKNIANANVAIGTLASDNWGVQVNNGTLSDGSSITIDKDGIEIIKTVSSVDTTTFSVDVDGNVSVKGDLTASTGTFGNTGSGHVILGNASNPLTVKNNTTTYLNLTSAGVLTVAGFTASDSSLYTGTKSSFASNDAGVYIATDGIALGTNSPFKVTSAGALTASSGTVGGWTLGASSLTGGNATLASSGNLTLGTSDDVVRLSADDATYRLWAGNATAASAPFSVTKAGALVANSADITGEINATSGSFSGVDITGTLSMGSSGSISIDGGTVIIDNAGIRSASEAFKLETDETGKIGGFIFDLNKIESTNFKLVSGSNPYLYFGSDGTPAYGDEGIFAGMSSTDSRLSLVSGSTYLKYDTSSSATYDLEIAGNAKVGPLLVNNLTSSSTENFDSGDYTASGTINVVSDAGSFTTSRTYTFTNPPLNVSSFSVNYTTSGTSSGYWTLTAYVRNGSNVIAKYTRQSAAGTFTWTTTGVNAVATNILLELSKTGGTPLTFTVTNLTGVRTLESLIVEDFAVYPNGTVFSNTIQTKDITITDNNIETRDSLLNIKVNPDSITGGGLAVINSDDTTHDGIIIEPSTTYGTSSRRVTLATPPTNLGANRRVTFPDYAGTLAISSSTSAGGVLYAISTSVVGNTGYATTSTGTSGEVLISNGTSAPSWDYVLKDISNFTGAVVSNGATAVLIPLDETLSSTALYAIEVNANTSTSVEGRTIHFFECPTLNDTVPFFQNDHTNSSSSTTIYKFELLNTSGNLYIDEAYQHLIGTSITASTGIRIWRVYRVMSHGG